ncbi:hypothetical protein KUCAC02_035357 [Chaenocephalus aceratus]|nr:hypothetical protein KUCAC02_035357 [Chaenocephalus aceratus]
MEIKTLLKASNEKPEPRGCERSMFPFIKDMPDQNVSRTASPPRRALLDEDAVLSPGRFQHVHLKMLNV